MQMVERVRSGVGMREVARQFRVSLSVVQRWVSRAAGQRLTRVDWRGKPTVAGGPANRTAPEVEALIVVLRAELAKTSELGEYGAEAIRNALIDRGAPDPPSVRTVGRILERHGLLDGHKRVRRPAPPLGWYLPEVAAGRAELDSFDTVSGLLLAGGIDIVVLNGISLHGGLVTSWPHYSVTSTVTASRLLEHWREFGRPGYAQFDNDNVFQGPHQYPDIVGRVMRTCLQVGVVPVFAPPREPGFQASIESYNGRWQAKVWSRYERISIVELQEHSDRYVAAVRRRAALRIDRAPTRHPLSADHKIDLQARPRGTLIFIRRCDETAHISLLGHRFFTASHWSHRLVRAEVDLDAECVRIFALRRREPALQPLLSTHRYSRPRRRLSMRE